MCFRKALRSGIKKCPTSLSNWTVQINFLLATHVVITDRYLLQIYVQVWRVFEILQFCLLTKCYLFYWQTLENNRKFLFSTHIIAVSKCLCELPRIESGP